MKIKKRILVCPLDWGLGHATRCVPVIRELIKQDVEVILGGDQLPMAFLKTEFPELESVKLPGYDIRYPKNGNMILKMLSLMPKTLLHISREHYLLQKIIDSHRIDAVISDNRFGLWSNKVPCVFITHQVMIKSPFLEKFLYRINKRFIHHYNECWIPDFAGEDNLSGDLSHKFPLPGNVKFVGPLSRFKHSSNENFIPQKEFKYDIAVIISGPESQRSIFEKMVLEQLQKTTLKGVVVRGIPGVGEAFRLNDTIEVFSHLDSESLREIIWSSEIILSRPGYSTIMDLSVLNKKAVFVSNLGQTEQEYLAEYLVKKNLALCYSQKEFNLETALLKKDKIKPLIISKENSNLLTEAVDSFLTGVKTQEQGTDLHHI